MLQLFVIDYKRYYIVQMIYFIYGNKMYKIF